MNDKEQLYPIYYNEKHYNEEDCDEVFVECYFDKEALRPDCAIYVGDGMYVYPNGEWVAD